MKNPQKAAKTATGKQPEKQPKSNRRGFLYQHRPGRPLPFLLGWQEGGKLRWQSFADEDARTDAATALAEKREEFGREVLSFDPREWRTWLAFKAKIGDADPMQVASDWLSRNGKPTVAMTVSEAVAAYTAAKKAEGVDEISIAHYSPIFDRFEALAGTRNIRDITRDDVHAFMAAQADAASETRKTRFARVRALFNWLLNEEKIERTPFRGFKTPKVKVTPVVILTLAQTQALFTKNTEGEVDQWRRETIGRLALEAFAGLRTDSAGQIVASEIHPDGLRIPAAKIKTQQDQFLENLPANLYPWLEWSKPKEWCMNQRQYANAKGAAFVRAGIDNPPHNCLRKGFASYHVAAFKNKAATALIMCHSSAKLLEKTYRGIATESDGKAIFQIMPSWL